MPRSSFALVASLVLFAVALPAQTAHITSSAGSITNGQVTVAWTARDNRPLTLSLEGLGSTVSIDSPFALVIHNRGVVTAADLTPQGEPQVEHLTPNPKASRYAERVAGVAVRYELADSEHQFTAEWSVLLREGSSYAQQSLTITTGDQAIPIDDIRLIDLQSPSSDPTVLTVSGTVQGSPLVLRQPSANFYLGFEQPLSTSSVVHGRGVSELASAVPLGEHQSVTYSAVIGVAQPNQLRRDFLAYLERERAHPYRTFLHYNSWFDIGFFTPYTQQDALTRIRQIGEELHVKRGVTLDSYLFDDGWDDHNDLWRIRPDFNDGFAPLQKAAAEYGTHIGIWLSPWGGYGPAKKERLATAKRDGFETMNGGLALSGPKYYARFHQAVTELVKKYGVNQFKLDGTGNVDTVVKGSQFSSDFDAAIHLIHDVRALKPDIYINLTTGTWPSPFWLMYADSIWRGGDDTSHEGVGTMREQWITYRDADTYNEVVKRGPLYPLNSLMLHGIVFAQKAPHLSTDPGNDFANEVRSYFGTGTQLQELYITPSLLTNADWDTLAEAAKWSRRNAATLKDTHWVGGDPRWLQVYGWASWSPEKGILTLRNPSNQPQSITLDVARIFELPAGAPTHYKAHSPWAADAAQPPIELMAGEPHTFELAPFQVLTLEALPQ